LVFRHAHKSDSSHAIAEFAITTGTGSLRKHLFGEHIEEWVTSCDNLGIKITAEGALPAVREFRAEPEPTPLEGGRQEYTKEAFVEAILEFIVGDDQVCVISFNLL
jgi:hypothetical protein